MPTLSRQIWQSSASKLYLNRAFEGFTLNSKVAGMFLPIRMGPVARMAMLVGMVKVLLNTYVRPLPRVMEISCVTSSSLMALIRRSGLDE